MSNDQLECRIDEALAALEALVSEWLATGPQAHRKVESQAELRHAMWASAPNLAFNVGASNVPATKRLPLSRRARIERLAAWLDGVGPIKGFTDLLVSYRLQVDPTASRRDLVRLLGTCGISVVGERIRLPADFPEFSGISADRS